MEDGFINWGSCIHQYWWKPQVNLINRKESCSLKSYPVNTRLKELEKAARYTSNSKATALCAQLAGHCCFPDLYHPICKNPYRIVIYRVTSWLALPPNQTQQLKILWSLSRASRMGMSLLLCMLQACSPPDTVFLLTASSYLLFQKHADIGGFTFKHFSSWKQLAVLLCTY